MINRCQLLEADVSDLRALGSRVRLADDEPRFQAAAGHDDTTRIGPVFATGTGVSDLRRAAELAEHDDEHVVEQTARFEIRHQRVDAPVERGQTVTIRREDILRRAAVVVPTSDPERDDADARLDQSAGSTNGRASQS